MHAQMMKINHITHKTIFNTCNSIYFVDPSRSLFPNSKFSYINVYISTEKRPQRSIYFTYHYQYDSKNGTPYKLISWCY